MKEKEKLIVVGAGGHARSVIDIILQNNEYDLIGCIDKSYGTANTVSGMDDIPIIGNDDMLEEFFISGVKNIFVAIGENKLRDKIFKKVSDIGFNAVNVISRRAYISERAKLKKGICVMAGACINVNTVIEDNCIINTNSSIDHDCRIGRSVHIAPGAAISGTVSIGDYTHIGTGVNVIDNVVVGINTFVGGGRSSLITLKTMLLHMEFLLKLIRLITDIVLIKRFRVNNYIFCNPL
ncbi:acetyltransferase [Anaerotignum faecicola]|nr:acetyltransferase [Anaerotignum faecicola]